MIAMKETRIFAEDWYYELIFESLSEGKQSEP